MRQRQRPPVWCAWAAAAWFAWVAADEWPLPDVHTLTPGGGPVAGGTLLTLSGAGFTRGDARLCADRGEIAVALGQVRGEGEDERRGRCRDYEDEASHVQSKRVVVLGG